MKKSKYINKFIIICMIIILNIFNYASYASFNTKESESYIKWSNQSEKEKEETIEPIPFAIDLKDAVKRSELNQELKLKTNEIPEKYDLRNDITINVKDQKNTNTCWAFSITSIFESNVRKNQNKSLVFSPRHIEYATSKTFLDGINEKAYNRELDAGGNAYLGFNYATAGNGPVLESDMPFENNTNKIKLSDISNKKVAAKLEEYRVFPNIKKVINSTGIKYSNGIAQDDGNSQYTEEDVKNIRTLIKKHIMKYGAVSSCTYTQNNNYFNDSKYQSKQASDYAYYCNDNSKVADHAITIIGWDDNFAIDNFNDSCKPKNKGAYLVLNSYGSSFGKNGYFYVSYDDVFIETQLLGIIKTNDVDYDNIYQYDELGQSYSPVLKDDETKETLTTVYAANVYNKNKTTKGEKELLKEVGVSITNTTNVEIYANLESDDKTKIELIASPGILEAGYHTVKLSTPLEIKGDKFVICAKYTNQEGVAIPIECNLKECENLSSFWDMATGEEGQSYLSSNKNIWSDVVKDLGIKNSNVCVKAFTVYESSQEEVKVESITLNKNKLEMTEGESTNLEVTFNPTNATNKEVQWATGDSNIATVDSNGNIKAIKEGKTTITATSKDGGKVASCEIIVNKKKTSDDDIYYGGNTEGTIQNIQTQVTQQKLVAQQDKTTATKILPYAGNNIIILISISMVIGISIYVYIKIQKYKDVK